MKIFVTERQWTTVNSVRKIVFCEANKKVNKGSLKKIHLYIRLIVIQCNIQDWSVIQDQQIIIPSSFLLLLNGKNTVRGRFFWAFTIIFVDLTRKMHHRRCARIWCNYIVISYRWRKLTQFTVGASSGRLCNILDLRQRWYLLSGAESCSDSPILSVEPFISKKEEVALRYKGHIKDSMYRHSDNELAVEGSVLHQHNFIGIF